MFKNKLLYWTFLGFIASGLNASDIFSYDDPTNAKNLHVNLAGTSSKGIKWTALDIKESDTEFHQKLFANPEITKGFADGQIRATEATCLRINDVWLPRFKKGQSHGGLTIFDEDQNPIGHVIAGGGDEPGASEVAYAYIPEAWGKGTGYSVLNAVITQWAPEVRKIGLGQGVEIFKELQVKENFCCFDNKPLERLDATASPSNPGSWNILDKNKFLPAASNVVPEELYDISQQEFQSVQELEKYVLETYFSPSGRETLASGKRYHFIDDNGIERTLSKHIKHDRLKYHFEYYLKNN